MTIKKPTTSLTTIFCEDGVAGVDYVIPPEVETENTKMSMQKGYPELQEKPLGAGGTPIKRNETNGILRTLSEHAVYQNAGGIYTFDQAIADKGGYPKNAVLYYDADGTGANTILVRSTKDNNTDNFVTNPSVIGSSWVNIAPPATVVNETSDKRLDIYVGMGTFDVGPIDDGLHLGGVARILNPFGFDNTGYVPDIIGANVTLQTGSIIKNGVKSYDYTAYVASIDIEFRQDVVVTLVSLKGGFDWGSNCVLFYTLFASARDR